MHEDEVLFTEFFNQRLKEKGYTLEDLSQETGIAMKHLESFSHGRFEHLPSAPYVHGYFVRLGTLLGFDPDEWWNRIRNEETVHKAGPHDRLPGNRFGRWRGRALVWGGAAVILVAIYIGARYTTILGQPQLAVLAPSADITTVSTGVITFQGTAKNADVVTVNNQNIPVAADGSWSDDVALQPGPNAVEIGARKLLGRTVTLTRQIYYNPAQPDFVPMPGSAASSGVTNASNSNSPSNSTSSNPSSTGL